MIDRVESILNVKSPALQQLLREASENFGENPQFWVRTLSLARLGEIWKLDKLPRHCAMRPRHGFVRSS